MSENQLTGNYAIAIKLSWYEMVNRNGMDKILCEISTRAHYSIK